MKLQWRRIVGFLAFFPVLCLSCFIQIPWQFLFSAEIGADSWVDRLADWSNQPRWVRKP